MANIANAESVAVEIEGLPGRYSLRCLSMDPILRQFPELRPREYRRLKFSGRADELSFALKTGNAPDVMSLNWSDYRRLAAAGLIIDLSEHLLRAPSVHDPDKIEAGWSPLRSSGDNLLRHMLVDGRIYGFPAVKHVHGLVVRRDLLEPGFCGKNLNADKAARLALSLAGRLQAEGRGTGIALPLDAELFLNWSIAEYAAFRETVSPADAEGGVDEQRAAMDSLNAVYTAFRDLIYSPVINCSSCKTSFFRGTGAYGEQSECPACGAGWVGRSSDMPPAGRIVKNVQQALDLFRAGSVAAVVCRRSSVVDLADAGMPPGELMFIPLAGSGSVPDVEILALYSGIAERDKGDLRLKLLVDFLKMYSSQFLVGRSSPLYLWHERILISEMAGAGYTGVYSDSEIRTCRSLFESPGAGSDGLVDDDMTGFELMIPSSQFLETAGLDYFMQVKPVIDSLIMNRAGEGDFATEVLKLAKLRPSKIYSVLILLFLLTGILFSAGCLFFRKQVFRRFRTCVPRFASGMLFFLLILCVLVVLRLGWPLASLSLSAAGGLLSDSVRDDFAVTVIKSTGHALINALLSVIIGCALALGTAGLAAALKRWHVFTGLLLSLPLALAGLWGHLLISAVAEWFTHDYSESIFLSSQVFVPWLRSVPAVWALLPLFVPGYICCIRRIDPFFRDALKLDKASPGDKFFLVTLPAVQPVLVLHALTLACVSMLSSSPALIGSVEEGGGGGLMRAILFEGDPLLAMVHAAVVMLAVLGLLAAGFRFIRTVKVVPVYGKMKA